VKESGIDKIPLSPEARKDRTIEALKQLVLRGSEVRPLILAYEDLHWVDKSSEDVLKNILESIPAAKVLMIFTYRPEFIHTWAGRSYHNQVNLNRLSNPESLAMVKHLLGSQQIDSGLEQFILEKTEGIPFFIEEFIRSLTDLQIIERKENTYRIVREIQDMTIPSTIQDVIMARVDSLPEKAKSVLQTGSVVGREFSHDLIKKVMGLPEPELLSHLSVLKDAELIYERGIYPRLTYIFKHALTNDTAYDSLLVKRKKETHQRIAMAMEELYQEKLEEFYEILADHFMKSESQEKGALYSRLAAKKAEKTASLKDAITHAQREITCLEKLSQTEDVQKMIIDARTALGLYYVQIYYRTEAKGAVDPIIKLAEDHHYKKRLAQIYTIMGIQAEPYEGFRSDAMLKRALEIANEVNDHDSMYLANYYLGMFLCVNCQFEKGFDYFRKALQIQVAAQNLWSIAAVKSLIGYFVHHFQGTIGLGHQITTEAVRVAEESGDIYSKAGAYTCHGVSCYGRGLMREASEQLSKGAEFCRRTGYIFMNAIAHHFLGEVFFELGEYEKSQNYYHNAIRHIEERGGVTSWANLNRIGLARAQAKCGEEKIDLEVLLGYASQKKDRIYEGRMAKYIAEILFYLGEPHVAESERWAKKAIEADTKNGMMFYLGKDYALNTEFFKQKGDQSKAKENLNKAIEIFKECDADGWVKKTEEEMGALC
jgi:tetratricopeptide (TPR) repeat protein